jgi:hypothetical protein
MYFYSKLAIACSILAIFLLAIVGYSYLDTNLKKCNLSGKVAYFYKGVPVVETDLNCGIIEGTIDQNAKNIYIDKNLNEWDRNFILKHEYCHIINKDVNESIGAELRCYLYAFNPFN